MPRPITTVFWLLDTTKAYAGEMLERSGEGVEVSRRHAIYLCEFLERTYGGSEEFVKGETWRAHSAYSGICEA